MNTREQVREAGYRVMDPPKPLVADSITNMQVRQVADAVSDVWEPIVEDLLEISQTMFDAIMEDDLTELNLETIRRQLQKHRKALR